MESPSLSSTAKNLTESLNLSENVNQQYVLPEGQPLQEEQQLAIEVIGDNGVKYLYILTNGTSSQETMEISNVETTSCNVGDKTQKNGYDKLKYVEDRSCGTMTENYYFEAMPEEAVEPQFETIMFTPHPETIMITPKTETCDALSKTEAIIVTPKTEKNEVPSKPETIIVTPQFEICEITPKLENIIVTDSHDTNEVTAKPETIVATTEPETIVVTTKPETIRVTPKHETSKVTLKHKSIIFTPEKPLANHSSMDKGHGKMPHYVMVKYKPIPVNENKTQQNYNGVDDRTSGSLTEDYYFEAVPEQVVKTKAEKVLSPGKRTVANDSSETKSPGKMPNYVLFTYETKCEGKKSKQALVNMDKTSNGIKIKDKVNCLSMKKETAPSNVIVDYKIPPKKKSSETIVGDKSIQNKSVRSLFGNNKTAISNSEENDTSHTEPETVVDMSIKKSFERMLDKEVRIVNIMNEMKVSRKDASEIVAGKDKVQNHTGRNKDHKDEIVEITKTQNNKKETNQLTITEHSNKLQENENPINLKENDEETIQNEHTNNSVNRSNKSGTNEYDTILGNIDSETCTEILANIEMEVDEKECASQTEASGKAKVKFQYERPTTRNMTRKERHKSKAIISTARKNGQKNFACTICKKVYIYQHSLQEHIKTHCNENFSCDICDKSFKSQRKLSNHIKTHSSDKPHLCEICGESFRMKETLENHIYTHSGTGDKPYKCDVCGMGFIKKYYLVRHKTCHTGERPFPCSDCDRKFRTRGDLHRHERIHGEKPGVKQYSCKICGKRYCAESGLIRHQRAHKGEKPYECEVCSKTFPMPGDLKRHYKTHFGGIKFKCQLCGKTLTSSVGFKRHQRMHSGEKPYECSICNNRFIDQWGLMKHKNIHEKTVPEKLPVKAKEPSIVKIIRIESVET